MRCIFASLGVAFALVASAAPGARAEVRTFVMEGSVSYKNDPLQMLDWVHFGDRMVYTFAFDSNAPDADPSIQVGVYDGLWAWLRVGDTPISVSAPGIIIQHPSDLFRLHSELVFASYEGDAYLTLADQSAISDALTNTSLPTIPYDLAPWQSKEFSIGIDVPQPGYPPIVTLTFGGNIDAFYAVPEPATLALLMPILLLARRRNS
jgi:hypothetical protein